MMSDSDEDKVMVIKLFFAVPAFSLAFINMDLFFLEQIMDVKTGML